MDRRTIFFGFATLAFVSQLAHGAAKLTLFAGGGSQNPPADKATNVKLALPFAIEFDSSGVLYVAEFETHRILTVDKDGRVAVLAGVGDKGSTGDGGPAAKARLNGPQGMDITRDGQIYVADTFNNKIRKIDANGNISTFAGTGRLGLARDGADAKKADFAELYDLTLDKNHNRILIADAGNRRVRAIDLKTNRISTIAGNGQKGSPRDGAKATEEPLVDPQAIAVDSAGTIYILDRAGHALRAVATDGTIRTLVNAAGWAGPPSTYYPAPAKTAKLSGPSGLCVDILNNVYIADTENHIIVKYLPKTGQLTRVAGTGKAGAGGLDGPPEKADLNRPHGVAIGPDEKLYIADSFNNRIVRIDN